MDQIYLALQEQFQQNQFLQGGALLAGLAALWSYLRSWPSRLWTFCNYQMFIGIDVPDTEAAFRWLDKWLSEHPYTLNRARDLTIKRSKTNEAVSFMPAPGRHYLFYKKRLVILDRERKEGSEDSYSFNLFRESLNIRVLGRNRQIIKDLVQEAHDAYYPKKDRKIKLFRYSNGCYESKRIHPRGFESVILPNDLVDDLKRDVDLFLDNETWYQDKGVPYRRGYLFYGPPGNGKSSLAVALASEFHLNIAIVNLNKMGLNDDSFVDMLDEIESDTLVLIEDIDCIFEKRKSSDDKASTLTFSGLLNGLDGVGAAEGSIVVMTTNHIDKLDPALIRPGRCDRKIHIGDPEKDECVRMFEKFFPGEPSDGFKRNVKPGFSMAQLQEYLMSHETGKEATKHVKNLQA